MINKNSISIMGMGFILIFALPELVIYSSGTRFSHGMSGSDVKVPVTVNLINQGGQQMEATAQDSLFDGETWVINVVMDSASTNKNGFGTFLRNFNGA